MNTQGTIELNREQLLAEEQPMSPEKEAEYRSKIETLLQKNAELSEENADLRQQVAFFKKALYGQKSEKTAVITEVSEQLSMFDEAEQEAEITAKHAEEEIEIAAHKRKAKRTQDEIMENLPTEEVLHEAEDKVCPECGAEMKTVGKEYVRSELVYVPAKLFLRKHYVEVLKCPSCGTDEANDASLSDVPAPVFQKATAPMPLIPHSFCSPELLAHILFEKYVQGIPLYRQEKEYKALGMELSRTTMANWIIYAANRFAVPVWEEMKKDLLKNSVIHADETVVQVLHEPGKKAKTESRMWVYAAPKASGKSNILFQYSPTRNGDNAVSFLGDYRGAIVCDGYDGYNKLTGVTRCGCFAHVRRKFVDALPTEKELIPTSKAAQGVAYCNRLFELEREYESLSGEEKSKQRQERTKPVLDGFFLWLDSIAPSGGTKLAGAVQYAKNEKAYLVRFLENPDIPIDNNRAENAIRPFVIGRKNWLFSDSVKGAQASAAFYSLAATATANGLNVEEYFTGLLASSDSSLILPW